MPLAAYDDTRHIRMGSDGAPRVEIKTSLGNFEVELYVKHAPKTCKNFIELSRRGYYNDTVVIQPPYFPSQSSPNIPARTDLVAILQMHRIIRDFMIQMGDPTGTGRGGESIYGGKFEVI